MKNIENNNTQTEVTAALAAASKTPFRTAFKITIAIGLGHLVLFLAGATLTGLIYLAFKAISG